MMAEKKILVVLHQENSTPGRVGLRLRQRGYTLDIRKPRFGDPLPKTMAGHDGAVIFGGPMSANDNEEYMRVETDWINVPLKEEKPFLGICLGGQMLVRHLGGRVEPHPEGHIEVGYYGLEPTEAGRDLMEWPEIVYQWHSEGMDAPAGSVSLATSATFETQAIQAGPTAFGIQFHPEVTLAMMHRWTTHGAHRFESPNARSRAEHMAGRLVHDRAFSAWLDRFLDLWLASGDARAGSVSPGAVQARRLEAAE